MQRSDLLHFLQLEILVEFLRVHEDDVFVFIRQEKGDKIIIYSRKER